MWDTANPAHFRFTAVSEERGAMAEKVAAGRDILGDVALAQGMAGLPQGQEPVRRLRQDAWPRASYPQFWVRGVGQALVRAGSSDGNQILRIRIRRRDDRGRAGESPVRHQRRSSG